MLLIGPPRRRLDPTGLKGLIVSVKCKVIVVKKGSWVERDAQRRFRMGSPCGRIVVAYTIVCFDY
jgi:hypothetical protein